MRNSGLKSLLKDGQKKAQCEDTVSELEDKVVFKDQLLIDT